MHPLPSPLLVVEASTSAGSVALLVNNRVVAERSVAMGPSRDDALLPAIAAVLNDAQLTPREVRAVACGSGPGSFTSLRIAASLAKGIVVANDATLYAIPSMLLAAAVLKDSPGVYLLHADALRSERYVARATVGANGDINLSDITRISLEAATALATQLHATLVAVAGTNNTEQNGIVLQPQARNAELLGNLWHTFGPVSIELWEPQYGRLAEAQVKWESTHGHALPIG